MNLQLGSVDGSLGRRAARLQGKEIDLDQSEIIFRVRTEKGPNRFGGNIFATSEGNVRMPRPEVRFESGRERGIGHAFVQLKEMRVARPHSEPDDPRAAARRESRDAAQRKKKCAEANGAQMIAQFFLGLRRDMAEEGEGQVHLLACGPAHAAEPGI